MLLRGINSAASCQYHSVDASMDIKQRKQLLQHLNRHNAANIPYNCENGELVQLITEFFMDESNSDDEGVERLIGGAEEHKTSDCGDELEDTTPLVTVCGAHSSVEIQKNAGSSFPTADAAASFTCKCTQIKTAEGAELPTEQRRGCISQFSVNSDAEVVEFQLNVCNIILWQDTFDHFKW